MEAMIVVCGAAVLLLISLLSRRLGANPRLPPGRTGWPVIGESLEFLRCLRNVELEKFCQERMGKYSPQVFRTSVFGDHVAVLCGSAGNKFLFSEDNKLVKTWVVRPIRRLFRVDRFQASFQQHVKHEIVTFITLGRLKKMTGVMDAMAQHHLHTHWDGLQVITTYPSVKRYAIGLACRIFMSIDDPGVVESMYDNLETLALGLSSIPINLPGSRMNRALKAVAALRSQLLDIATRHADSCDDKDSFISRLLLVCDDHEDVVDALLLVLLAGTDTASSATCIVLKVMAEQPHIYSRVYQENIDNGTHGELLSLENTHKMKYTWNVVREVMRLYPPDGLLTREASTNFTYAGYDIPKGYKLITSISGTHKDPKYFPDPEKFDPSRFDDDGPLPYTYIPFGGGSHLCPGMNYAQQLILVFIHNVVKKFKWEAKIDNEKITGIPFTKPSQGFPIILHPHGK